MSAHIVTPGTILKPLAVIRERGQAESYTLAHLLAKHGYETLNGCEVPDTTWAMIAADLWVLNHAAVNLRYSEDTQPEPLAIVWDSSISEGTALKYLHCLRYQCSEGWAVESPIYAMLQDLIGDLCANIAVGDPDYQSADWGCREEVAA